MTDVLTRHPNIAKAAMFLSYANNGVSRERSEDVAREGHRFVLDADGVYEEDLQKMDQFLSTLTQEELSILCDGEETEAKAISARAPDPEKLEGLLNDLFENC
jgi:hypothetical protein